MFSGALFIKSALGFEGEAGLYISVLILLALAALFTIGGGLTAVIYTDFVQAILMVLGSIILTALGKILQTFDHRNYHYLEILSNVIESTKGNDQFLISFQ